MAGFFACACERGGGRFWYADPARLAVGRAAEARRDAAFRATDMRDGLRRIKESLRPQNPTGTAAGSDAAGLCDPDLVPEEDATARRTHNEPPPAPVGCGIMALAVPLPGLSARDLAASWEVLSK
ncbi:unnamed protein product [Phytomonas sp. Hart1]|nr:unnamed protein product [Phytomonas sp. Hart1]|eukprot:CCW66187.1 unnamed protein product [Phytomonas sp. isolate Hart1]